MKKLLLFITLMFASSSISAQMSCYTDYFGNYICNSYGDTGDWNSRTYRDVFGNDNTSGYDNDSNSSFSYFCYTDVFGNYVCN